METTFTAIEEEAYENGRLAANFAIDRFHYPEGSPEEKAYEAGWYDALAEKQAAFEAGWYDALAEKQAAFEGGEF